MEMQVFAWGANSYGQLGLHHKRDVFLPELTGFSCSELKQITGGGGHTIFVSDKRQLYVCGWNKHGQLGLDCHHLTEVAILQPVIELAQKVTKVSCGWNHTLCIVEGQMLVWGSNTYGQLGIQTINKLVDSPTTKLDSHLFKGQKVLDIGAGLRHSVALTDDGTIYTWGDGKKGQLGNGKMDLSLVDKPQSVRSTKCKAVAAGAYHSAAITEDCKLLMWGLNQHGQCGFKEMLDTISPDQVKIAENKQIVNVFEPLIVPELSALMEVHCGWSNTLAISAHRKVFTWGRGDYGQLGYKFEDTCSPSNPGSFCHIPKEISALNDVKQVACGSEHTIAIDAKNRVVTFGWNEHGMCGTGHGDNMYSPHIVTIFEKNWIPLLVGAGAGHSMVTVKATEESSS